MARRIGGRDDDVHATPSFAVGRGPHAASWRAGIRDSARIDPQPPPFYIPPSVSRRAPMAELVDASELKIGFRKECWFNSG